MDRASLLEHLQMTERHIVQGREQLASLERRIVQMSQDGHDTSGTASLLATLRETQGLHEADRAMVQRQIEECDRA